MFTALCFFFANFLAVSQFWEAPSQFWESGGRWKPP